MNYLHNLIHYRYGCFALKAFRYVAQCYTSQIKNDLLSSQTKYNTDLIFLSATFNIF